MSYSETERIPQNPLASRVVAAQTSNENTHGELELPDGTWDIIFRRNEQGWTAMVTGRINAALPVPHGKNEELIIVSLKPHTFLQNVSNKKLVNDVLLLPVYGRSILLDGSLLEIPTWDNVDTFLEQLEKQHIVEKNVYVERALAGIQPSVSLRTIQRHFLQTTGLTPYHFAQIHRAQKAEQLLQEGRPPVEVSLACGYADQSHMIRALKQFRGYTPRHKTVS